MQTEIQKPDGFKHKTRRLFLVNVLQVSRRRKEIHVSQCNALIDTFIFSYSNQYGEVTSVHIFIYPGSSRD